jgi:hypothetical protein
MPWGRGSDCCLETAASICDGPPGWTAYSPLIFERLSFRPLHHGLDANSAEPIDRAKGGRLDLSLASGLQYSKAIPEAVERSRI